VATALSVDYSSPSSTRPPADYPALKDAGVAAIFPPGAVIAEAAIDLLDQPNRRLGYTQGEAAE
jgi:methylmalonyl-CoA mutase